MRMINRRKFFKRAINKCLPIIGAIVATTLPIKADSIPNGCKDCAYMCNNHCQTTCKYMCKTMCGGACERTCKRTCNNTCRVLCAIGCTSCIHTTYK